MTNEQLKQEILRISNVNVTKCMKCGKCTASCPAYDEMESHPHQFVSMVNNGDIQPLLNSESIYRCLSCFACMERCPRGVEPAKLVSSAFDGNQKAGCQPHEGGGPSLYAGRKHPRTAACQRVP